MAAMLTIIKTILIGFFAGLLARVLMPGANRMGIILTVLLGIGGAVFAAWLGGHIGLYKTGETAGFIGAVIGAMLIIVIYRFIRRPEDNSDF